MQLSLPANIISLQDLKELLGELKAFAHWFSQAAIKLQVTKKQPVSQPHLSEAASIMINQLQKSDSYNELAIDQLIHQLEKLAGDAPLMTVTLAGPASVALKQQIANWSRTNISSKVLIDFRFDRTLIGGMVVHFGSHTHDWSVRTKLLASSSNFTKALRHV